MNIPPPKIPARRGSAVLIVLVLLTLMAAIVVSNNLTLHHLERNLRLIERKQLKRSGVHQTKAH
jgi:type II secretory pathway component PulK